MVSYWPILANTKDLITNNEMVTCVNASFVMDRFNIKNSALYLQNGYCQVKPGVYFKGNEFTFTAWVKIITIGKYCRIIDFGNGQASNNVIVSYTFGKTMNPFIRFYFINGSSSTGQCSIVVQLNKWIHFSAVFDRTVAYLYIDEVLCVSLPMINNITDIVRRFSYIGKSNWNTDDNVDAYLDDIKIYNRALTVNELIFDGNI